MKRSPQHLFLDLVFKSCSLSSGPWLVNIRKQVSKKLNWDTVIDIMTLLGNNSPGYYLSRSSFTHQTYPVVWGWERLVFAGSEVVWTHGDSDPWKVLRLLESLLYSTLSVTLTSIAITPTQTTDA